jgi:hypothetical protein
MPIKPRPAPKGTLIELLRSWKLYEGDFDVKDIGPYRRLCAYFIGRGHPAAAIKALRNYGMSLAAARPWWPPPRRRCSAWRRK